LTVVVEAERPPKIQSGHDAKEGLGGTVGVPLSGKYAGRENVKLVSIIHCDEENLVVPCDGGHLTQSGRKSNSVFLLLSGYSRRTSKFLCSSRE
jgi:hypothetical protein